MTLLPRVTLQSQYLGPLTAPLATFGARRRPPWCRVLSPLTPADPCFCRTPGPLTINLQPGGLLHDPHGVAGLAAVGASVRALGPLQLQLPAASGVDHPSAGDQGVPILEPGDVGRGHPSRLAQEPHGVALHDGHLARLVGAPDGGGR